MLTKYMRAALGQAVYEQTESGEWFGEIPGFKGLWAQDATKAGCATELEDALGDWLIVSFQHGIHVPVVDDIDLSVRASA